MARVRIPEKYKPIVGAAAKTAGAIGVPGAFSFGLDVTAMTGIWGTMTVAIAEKSGHKVDKIFAGKLASAVLVGVGGYVGGSKIVMKLFHLVPGAGSIAAMGVNSFMNAWFTYRVGKALANLFDTGDYSPKDLKSMVQYLLIIIMPVPTISELGEAVSLMAGTSFVKPETFKMLDGTR